MLKPVAPWKTLPLEQVTPKPVPQLTLSVTSTYPVAVAAVGVMLSVELKAVPPRVAVAGTPARVLREGVSWGRSGYAMTQHERASIGLGPLPGD